MSTLFIRTGAGARIGVLLVALWWTGASLAAPFVGLSDDTVIDSTTGLIWDRCPLGRSGADCRGGRARELTWQNALKAVVNANEANHKGHNDWRLPNRTELESLVEITQRKPAIDSIEFPNTPSDEFWSSTVYARGPERAWYADFEKGKANHHSVLSTYYVRLVRGGGRYDDRLHDENDPETYIAASPTGSGDVKAEFTSSNRNGAPACHYVKAQYITADEISGNPGAPSGVTFPHGLFDFIVSLCSGTQVFTMTYPVALPEDAQYWKYGPTSSEQTPHWYTLPSDQVQISPDRKTWTIIITDGGLGDDDLIANGVIVDQGGPGIGGSGAGGGAGTGVAAVSLPVLPVPLMAALALLIGVVGWRFGRR